MTAALTCYTVVVSAALSEITLIGNTGLEYGNPLNNAFVESGDTVRFILDNGSVAVQSESLPPGTSPWGFSLGGGNMWADIIIAVPGHHHFSIDGITFGTIICIDPNAALRYFEFMVDGYPSSENFLAGTSDPVVLHMADSLLALPQSQRHPHIKGLLAQGNGGFNYDWGWHIQENRWRLAEISEEVCDGWPTFVDDSFDFWMGVGYFCPWNSKLVQEVSHNSVEDAVYDREIVVYPIPATEYIQVQWSGCPKVERISLIDVQGRGQTISTEAGRAGIGHLPPGIYFLKISACGQVRGRTISIQ